PENGNGVRSQAQSSEWTIWGQAVEARGEIDGNRNTTRMKDRLSGAFVGADRAVGESGHLGLVVGTAHTSLTTARSKRSTGNDTTIGIYGSAALGAWQLRAGGGSTRQKLSVDRQFDPLGAAGATAGRVKARLTQGFLEAGYPMALAAGVIEPFAQ